MAAMEQGIVEQNEFRHEWKHYISMADVMELRSRLCVFAKRDENTGPKGSYKVRSLYFDNYADKAVTEKLSGQSRREKFRLRYYGDDTGFVRLEKKSKVKRLCAKTQTLVTTQQCVDLLEGRYGSLQGSEDALLQELHCKMQNQILRPKTIVDYEREAYVYGPGNVRITIDSRIRTSPHVQNFLNPHCVTIPAANAIVLEIKYDAFLPEVIRDAVQLRDRGATEFSKYVVSRLV